MFTFFICNLLIEIFLSEISVFNDKDTFIFVEGIKDIRQRQVLSF